MLRVSVSEQKKSDNGAPARIPPEAFNTPELKKALAEAIAQESAKSPEFKEKLKEAVAAEIRAKHPPFWEAVKADTEFAWASRGEPRKFNNDFDFFRGAVELAVKTDAFLGLALYRARTRLLARQVPVIPNVLHRICMACFQMCIGESVVIEPGVYIPHGQVVIDGAVEIGQGTVMTPWITIGLRDTTFAAPKIGRNVLVGTGASILGPVTVGSAAKIGSRAVVIKDVAPNTTVVGAPAEPLGRTKPPRGKAAETVGAPKKKP